LFFIKPGAKVNGQHNWDILLFQHMLDAVDAVKHVADDNSVFHDSALAHRASNTVHLLQRKTLNRPEIAELF